MSISDNGEDDSDSDSGISQAEKILDVLIPPAQFVRDGVQYIQRVRIVTFKFHFRSF